MVDEYDDQEEMVVPASASWLDAVQDQFGSAPWWIISVIFHVTFVLLSMVIVVAVDRSDLDRVPFTSFTKREQEEQKKVEDIIREEKPTDVQTDVIVHDDAEDDHLETEDDMDLKMAHGDEDAISDIPLGGTATVGFIGVGGGGAGMFRYRTGSGKRKALTRGGGSDDTENAVNRALDWLARHQEPDGRWDGEKYGGEDTDAGISGLACLAFLGAGHTERTGKYKNTVLKAVEWIIKQQEANGSIGRSSASGGLGYHHAICGMALSEAYGMAKVPATGAAAQKAVDYSINEHQVPYSGWRYNPRQEPDTSITGWFVMQLKSAKVSGLKVAGEGFQGAINWLDKVTDMENYSGRTGYQSKEQASRPLTAVGMVCRLFMGWKPDDPLLRGGAEFLLEDLPAWGAANEHVNFYYWYYGSIAMFQMGGDYWKKWNVAMKSAVLPNQRKGGDEDGSWDPVCPWGANKGGRVYMTALGALMLEVYYRYLPMYR